MLKNPIQDLIYLFFMTVFIFPMTGCKGQGTGILGQQTATSVTEDPLLKNAPFAFDYAADTISYNSCVIGGTGNAADPVGLHGLKLGSNEGFIDNLGTGAVKSGIKLRTDFLKYIGKNFSPDYPSDVITPAQVARILNTSYSIFNANAHLNFAIRRKSDYAVIPDLIAPPTVVQSSNKRDAVVFEQNLSSGYLGYSMTKSILFKKDGSILAEGPRIYDLTEAQNSVPIEGSFNLNATVDETYQGSAVAPEAFGGAELYSQRVRDAFNAGTQVLTATFGGTDSTTGVVADDIVNNTINNIKRPYKSGTNTPDSAKAFGRGYQLKFEAPPLASATWPKNQLSKVTEINLDTGTPDGGASWVCEQFPIAHPSHWNNTKTSNKFWVKDAANTSASLAKIEPNCAPLLAEDTECSNTDSVAACNVKKDRAEKLKRIRRHYSVDAWNVGLMFVEKLKAAYVVPMPISQTNTACVFPSAPPYIDNCYAREFDIVKDTSNPACLPPNGPLYPSSCFINKGVVQLCVSPKTTSSCYLPTTGILTSGLTNPNDASLDVGVQYDRTQDCYLTMATVTGSKDAERKKGRCAQFASVCTRTSSSY